MLHELWPLAGRARVRITDAMLCAGAVLLTLPMAWTTPFPAAASSAIVAVAAAFALLAATGHPYPPRQLKLSIPATPGRTLAFALMAGLAYGLATEMVLGRVAGVAVGVGAGLAHGLATGLAIWLADGLKGPPSKEAHPWGLLRDGLVLDATAGLVLGLPLGFMFGLTLGMEGAVGLTSGLTVGLPLGTVGSMVSTLTGTAARRYAVFLLCSSGRLPFRLVVFLDWACEAGLLRYAGPAYQFRHRELQQWLTTHPDPVDPPPGP